MDTNVKTPPAPVASNDGPDCAEPTGSAVFEIANPSDKYTIKGPFMACAIAVAMLGNGSYGIEGTPILFGWDEWLKGKGIEDLGAHIDKHNTEIAAALDSVLMGDERDREEVDATLRRIPPDQHEAWLAERHDRRRSSMNDIGRRARELASRVRGQQNVKSEESKNERK